MTRIAQANVARLRAPLNDSVMVGFVARIDEINQLAERSPGFVWRYVEGPEQTGYARPFDEPLILFNLSVWESLEDLRAFVYASDHAQLIRGRHAWIVDDEWSLTALWHLGRDHFPDVAEAKERLAHLRRNGDSPFAFTFRRPFPPASDSD